MRIPVRAAFGEFAFGEGRVFASPAEVRAAYDHGEVHLQAKIVCRINGKRYETTTGRVLLWDIVPRQLGFEAINKVMDKKQLGGLIDLCYRVTGEKETVLLADRVRSMGYTHATKAGISFGVDDMVIPANKESIIEEARSEVVEIERQRTAGAITAGERHNKIIDVWHRVTERVSEEMFRDIKRQSAELQAKLPTNHQFLKHLHRK